MKRNRLKKKIGKLNKCTLKVVHILRNRENKMRENETERFKGILISTSSRQRVYYDTKLQII